MNALRRQNIRPQQTFERWTPRTQESPHELARQSEAKRKQAPQSEANVCRHKCNLKKPRLLIAQDTHQKLGFAFKYLNKESDRGQTITAKKPTTSMISHQKTQEYIIGKSPFIL